MTVSVHETDERVVGLTAHRAGLLRTAAARRERLELVTGEQSCLTLPLRDALVGTGGTWVVRESPDGADQSPRTAVERRRTAPAAQLITLTLSVRHSARPTTVLGRAAELAVERLTGALPTSWGPHEPVTAPWDRRALTAMARDRMPEPSRFIVSGAGADGAGAIGTVLVRRTQEGLEEVTTVELVAGPEGSDAARAVTDRVPEVLDTLADETMPLLLLATTRTGRADLLVPPVAQALPAPLALLLGPPGVRQLEVDSAEAARRFRAVRVGRRRLPSLRFPLAHPLAHPLDSDHPLGSAGEPGWDRTEQIARWLRAEEAVGHGA